MIVARTDLPAVHIGTLGDRSRYHQIIGNSCASVSMMRVSNCRISARCLVKSVSRSILL